MRPGAEAAPSNGVPYAAADNAGKKTVGAPDSGTAS